MFMASLKWRSFEEKASSIFCLISESFSLEEIIKNPVFGAGKIFLGH